MSAHRLEFLHARHSALEQALRQAMKRPLPDVAEVVAIKRRKLMVKDQIAALSD
jgi:hypothetical protein